VNAMMLVVVLLAFPACAEAGRGLIAEYHFDEGKGSTLHDNSGNGNHGSIHGATWAPSGAGFALRFDGVDDYVDFGDKPGLSPVKAVSVEAWVYPEAVPATGEPGVVGKGYDSYVLTYYKDSRFWWYISGGGNHCRATASTGAWHHLVGTFDGKLMGNSTGPPTFTRGAHFRGMIDEMRIYDRALSAAEVAGHYRTTRITNKIELRAFLSFFSGIVAVEMDLRGLGELPARAVAFVELCMPGKAKPVAARRVSPLPSGGKVEVTLKVGELAPGNYELRATAMTPDGRRIGMVAQHSVTWPKRPRWKDAPRAKVLNNLVTELLSAETSRTKQRRFRFVSPRDGWVFISCKGAAVRPLQSGLLLLDGQRVTAQRNGSALEAMRLLPSGRHTLEVRFIGRTEPSARIIVRAVPELVFSKFGAHPHVHEYGKYDWEFLKKHVLADLNVLVCSGSDAQKPFLREWKRQGRRCVVECGVPGLGAKESVSPDEAEKYWSSHRAMTDPLPNGVIVDEFFGGNDEKYAAWTEAVRRIRANPKLKGRLFYPYCGAMYGAKDSREFIRAIIGAGWRFAFERYLPEQRTEARARAYLDGVLRQTIASWEQATPGAKKHMIVCVGTFSQPPESLDVNPAVNHKVFLDMQVNLLANDPACFGLGGVMTYLCSYTDEETVRWMGKLFRHYCIEGKSRPLSSDPYVLPHLRNGDFEDGLSGWTASAAEPGGVAARKRAGFSWLQGRYPKTSQGDTVLWMRRSARRANVVSQAVKALEPGRLYTFRMYSGDFQDLAFKRKHALSIRFTNVDVLGDRSFQHVFASCYSHHHGPYNRQHRAWMNYHWVLFRPKNAEATLTISDWATDKQPGGPIGQELMLNFIQIQPYD